MQRAGRRTAPVGAPILSRIEYCLGPEGPWIDGRFWRGPGWRRRCTPGRWPASRRPP